MDKSICVIIDQIFPVMLGEIISSISGDIYRITMKNIEKIIISKVSILKEGSRFNGNFKGK